MRRLLLLVLCSSTLFAQTTFRPTTTLAAETGNNSSAPDAIAIYTSLHAASGNVSKQPIRELLYGGQTQKSLRRLWDGLANRVTSPSAMTLAKPRK